MKELRLGQIERAVQQKLAKGGEKQVGSSYYFGDSHGGVIDGAGKLVTGLVVFSPDDKIAELTISRGGLLTKMSVNKSQSFLVRQVKAPVEVFPKPSGPEDTLF